MPVNTRSAVRFSVAALAVWLTADAARGDEFVLTTGGRVGGVWRNTDKPPQADYEVETDRGVRLLLAESSVQQVIRSTPQRAEYDRFAPAQRDTAEDQWKLAEWCRTRDLKAERTAALQRVIVHDPNHLLARRALGFLYINGEWTTPREVREREGYVLYRGVWRTPQEVEIVEAKAKRELAEKEWTAKLRRWRSDLELPNKAQAAHQLIAGIKDPNAIGPITQMWRRESQRPLKLLYADVLLNIKASETIDAIALTSLNDPDDEVFYECLDRLIKLKLKPARLSEPYIAALKDKNNIKINRAAKALASIKDRTALSPLIDALVTQHTVFIPGKGNAPPGGYAATFTGDGNSSLTSGDDPKLQLVRAHNDDVLTALTKLTGANFGYDKQAWRYWLSQEKRQASVSPTRRE